ncbi:hypothetical protein A1Q1_07776 [Trichosporon asahii var. asahii CBS 2479]|uniref:Uncharacterized protein n=1 Tax=Trichosporon asahii var. asahii (strain ATCC 90039 / CBS 2479 / JCM 2466 / KCTC 7840 / NBRC 103889/ NCYC 2677 / UAMH 7654) TaxID=1186058 RepID=J6F6P4_TRIAS|nr:hypothetical protein A1Q1_07776 [Trichosporon asahii var. asahii CBS 2479]EJT50982.1 hypothetical protein A1Q1_07776 [Trichosporon asahii var. asahii CBS 2479]
MLRPSIRLGVRTAPGRAITPLPAPLRIARPGTHLRYNSVKPPNVPTSSSGEPVAPKVNAHLDPKTQEKIEKKLGRLERYAPALAQLSQRTGVSLPALTGAFLVLHEVTAVVPVFLVYWMLHALGVGAGLVAWLADTSSSADSADSADSSVPVDHESTQQPAQAPQAPRWKQVIHGWYEEGARKVERVGRRYGTFGYEKGSKPGEQPDGRAEAIVTHDAGAVADAIAAYVVVKVSPRISTSTSLLFCCEAPSIGGQ